MVALYIYIYTHDIILSLKIHISYISYITTLYLYTSNIMIELNTEDRINNVGSFSLYTLLRVIIHFKAISYTFLRKNRELNNKQKIERDIVDVRR